MVPLLSLFLFLYIEFKLVVELYSITNVMFYRLPSKVRLKDSQYYLQMRTISVANLFRIKALRILTTATGLSVMIYYSLKILNRRRSQYIDKNVTSILYLNCSETKVTIIDSKLCLTRQETKSILFIKRARFVSNRENDKELMKIVHRLLVINTCISRIKLKRQ